MLNAEAQVYEKSPIDARQHQTPAPETRGFGAAKLAATVRDISSLESATAAQSHQPVRAAIHHNVRE
jgi:hypothetical protein